MRYETVCLRFSNGERLIKQATARQWSARRVLLTFENGETALVTGASQRRGWIMRYIFKQPLIIDVERMSGGNNVFSSPC